MGPSFFHGRSGAEVIHIQRISHHLAYAGDLSPHRDDLVDLHVQHLLALLLRQQIALHAQNGKLSSCGTMEI